MHVYNTSIRVAPSSKSESTRPESESEAIRPESESIGSESKSEFSGSQSESDSESSRYESEFESQSNKSQSESRFSLDSRVQHRKVFFLNTCGRDKHLHCNISLVAHHVSLKRPYFLKLLSC